MRSDRRYYLLCVFLILVLSGCDVRGQTENTKGGVVKRESQKEAGTSSIQKPDEPEVYEDEDRYAVRDNLKPVGETVEYNGIEYTVTSVTFSKDLGGRNPEIINYFGEETDGSGSLTGAQSYIFLELQIKNVSDESREELVNHPFVLVENDNRILETGTECRGIENPQEGHTEADAHHFILKPGENAEVRAVYIIEDKYLTDELYFLVGNGGSSADDTRNRFIHVGSEVSG